ncbi:MAG: sigma-70 family RNA polymerase sigma factor [Bacteroidetes bacterium]|nr:sigma-70 family RNA polymerase sigma factor [Bacteroidota bacterium]
MATGIALNMTEQRSRTIGEIVKTYGSRLFGFVRNRVNNEEDARDILQDVWYQLSNLVDIDSIEQMNAWLHRVARNKITDSYRKSRPESLDSMIGGDEEGDFDFLLPADWNTPETEHQRKQIYQELMIALDGLPPAQRDVFVWNELEDMTLQEISEITGENLKTIISRKGYAVKALRKKLESLYKEHRP